MDYARQRIDDDYQPAAFNIGINDGQAAGQAVSHRLKFLWMWLRHHSSFEFMERILK